MYAMQNFKMFDLKRKNRKRRFVRNISDRDMKIYQEYYECIEKYFDVNGIGSSLNITTPPPTTTTVTNSSVLDSSTLVSATTTVNNPINYGTVGAIGGATVAFLFILIIAICCLGYSRRTERKKRKLTEAENRAMATTLTSITDTEDGTMYAQCINQPMYGTDLQLPSKKQRNRLGGVSNGIQTMKRWFSAEGDSRTDNSVIHPYAVRQLPLPAIPEASSKSNSFPRQRGNVEKTLSIRENVYDEIGPNLLRRSNVYNPLLLVKPSTNLGEGSYDSIRSSTLPTRGSTRKLKNGSVDDYFVLEPTIQERTRPDESLSDNYFIVEKENKQENSANVASSAVEAPADTNLNIVNRKNTEEEEAGIEERQRLLSSNSSEETKGSNNNDETNNYFLLESTAKQANHPDDYLEPVEKQRHSYIDVLPEHKKLVQMKNKHVDSTRSQDTRL